MKKFSNVVTLRVDVKAAYQMKHIQCGICRTDGEWLTGLVYLYITALVYSLHYLSKNILCMIILIRFFVKFALYRFTQRTI